MLLEEKLQRVVILCRTSCVTVDSAQMLHLLALPPKELTIVGFRKVLLSSSRPSDTDARNNLPVSLAH